MTKMTPQAAAESLKYKSKLFPGMKDELIYAASLLRKIANKRLVDKDELLKIFGQYVERRGDIICNEMGLQDILDIIGDAPEVISFKKDGEK